LLQRFLRFFDPKNIPLRMMQQDSSTIVSGSTGVIMTLISSTTFPTSTRPANQEEIANERLIWFNPPYSKNVKTNVAKNFLQLIDKHFPAEIEQAPQDLQPQYNQSKLLLHGKCKKRRF
jgi:hypothetical protein